MATRPRSIIYIDGFNLYYGAVRGGSNKWLDIQRYFTTLRQADDIRKIYYFTARVSGKTAANQLEYWKALATLPMVEIRLGRFKDKTVTCRVDRCTFTGIRRFLAAEEKQTDVAIGVQMIQDAYEDSCDQFIIVSGDSDLLPAINAVKVAFPKKRILAYVPSRDKQRGAAVEIRASADWHRTLPQALLKRCQFPDRFADGQGGFIKKPPAW